MPSTREIPYEGENRMLNYPFAHAVHMGFLEHRCSNRLIYQPSDLAMYFLHHIIMYALMEHIGVRERERGERVRENGYYR